MFQRAKERSKGLLNRLLLRPLIWETRHEVKQLLKRFSRTQQTLDIVSDSVLIVDKKIEFLSAKIDAHAEVEDQFKNSVIAVLGEIRSSLELANRAAADLQTKAANLQEIGDRIGEQIGESTRTVISSVKKTAQNEFRQTEALSTLSKLLDLKLPLPATRGWAASPDFLLYLYQHITHQRPRLVVELGSGVSTVVAAAALKANGDGGQLYSLDHDADFAEATSRMLEERGFGDIATVHHAPLGLWKPTINTKLGEEWQWYSVPDTVNALQGIDLLIIDGPPEGTGPYARYPAVPHFRARMVPGCIVLLDDARRNEEKAAADAWALDRSVRLEYRREFEKGLAVLTAEDPSAGEEPAQPEAPRQRRAPPSTSQD